MDSTGVYGNVFAYMPQNLLFVVAVKIIYKRSFLYLFLSGCTVDF